MLRRKAAIAAAVLVASTAAAGGVVAASRSSDEAALAPTRQEADRSIERRVERLLDRMTLQEKLQQITLLPDFRVAGPAGEAEARNGLGSILSLTDPARIRRLQEIAVNESRLGIPILFAFDTIHGYRTVFPIPLGSAATFDPDAAFQDASFGARESTAVGLKQTYAPMVDVSHEPRWGRISEGGGEDPYLNSVMAAARVKGTQGGDYSDRDKMVASPKHLAAYGEPEAGRDYATTDMSLSRLWNFYLPPFKAAVDAGADTAMCSFNSLNGSPGCGNDYLMNEVLKDRWDFDGFVESDWTAVAELRACPPLNPSVVPDCGHGVAADGPDAAALALNSGVDSEMTTTFFRDFGAQLLSQRRVSMRRIDDAVRRILRVKFRAGLFEDPYARVPLAEAEDEMLEPDAIAAAREAAGKSMVLLKNDDDVLPLDSSRSTAVIGPLADNKHDMLGPWWGRGNDNDAVTVLAGIDDQNSARTTYAEGCQLSNGEVPFEADPDLKDRDPEGCQSDAGFAAAEAAAAAADQVVLALGETREMSGEANARSTLDLPGRQEELLRRVVAAANGKPVAVVLFSGRPLALENIVGDTKAIVQAWFPGVQAGHAVADVVFGAVNPGGKLPASFPYRVGQVPIYYNHENAGRPCNKGIKWNSQHRDIPSCDPLFVFGHGLSYTEFEVSNLRLTASSVSRHGSLKAMVDVENTGAEPGDEVVQLYIHDPVASLSQPVRRLRGFERVTLAPGASETVTFTLDSSDFGFYDNTGRYVVEQGRIDVYAGNSSKAELRQSFTVR